MALPVIIVSGLGGTVAAYEIRDAVKGKAEVIEKLAMHALGIRKLRFK